MTLTGWKRDTMMGDEIGKFCARNVPILCSFLGF